MIQDQVHCIIQMNYKHKIYINSPNITATDKLKSQVFIHTMFFSQNFSSQWSKISNSD